MPLPGSDKYRRPVEADDAPWLAPIVVKANTEVPFAEVLNRYFGMHVPVDAEGWKVRCPLYSEHEDGGLDRQFRVYASTNHGYCFALHGSLDPVRLWRQRSYFPSHQEAARDLLRAFDIDWHPVPYWERMAALRDQPPMSVDADTVVSALTVWLNQQPGYDARQYDKDVLTVVNYLWNQVPALCARTNDIAEVETWLDEAKRQLTTVLG